jgi:hypothetical protein
MKTLGFAIALSLTSPPPRLAPCSKSRSMGGLPGFSSKKTVISPSARRYPGPKTIGIATAKGKQPKRRPPRRP